MAITDGEPVNAAASNAAWLSKKQDDTTVGKLGLNNPDIGSGASVTNTQKAINKTFETSGIVDENDVTNNTYSSHEVITDGDDRKVAIGKLDAQVDANLQNITQNTSDISDNASDIATNTADIATLDSEAVKLTGDQTIAGIKTFSDNVILNGDLEVNGTTTTVNSATLDVADTNITINNGGTDASSEGAGITVERVGTDGSIVYENALDNRFKIGDDGSEEEIYAVVKDTKANLDAIVTKSTSRIYVATDEDDTPYRYNTTSGDLEKFASGESGNGSPSIYSILNAENDELADWTTSGGTLSYETVSPLAGSRSYKYEPSAATDTTKSIIIDVPLRSREGGKNNTFKMAYSANDSGISVNILGVTSATTLISQPIDETLTEITFDFPIAEAELQIQVEIECVSFTASMDIVFDDIVMDDRPVSSSSVSVAVIEDSVPSGTNGGTFTSGSYLTRNLNTLTGDTSIVTLLANQMTIGVGEWEMEYQAPAFGTVNGHKCKIRNITDATDLSIGSTMRCGATDDNNISNGVVRFTLAAPKVFELQHRCVSTVATTGLGSPVSFGDNEVYSRVVLRKIG